MAVAVLASAAPAWGHSFLVSTTPGQGQRLAAPPSELVLRFSERVDLASVKVTTKTVAGAAVDMGRAQLSPDGVEVTIPLGEAGPAVYLVGWEAFSAVDGHGSSGEFAFAAGNATGAVPTARSAAPTSARGVLASWLFFLGLSLAAGALVVRGLLGSGDGGPSRATVRIGLFGAMLGAALALPGTPDGWQQVLLLGVLQLLAAALMLVALTSRWWAPLMATVAAGGAWAGRSHAAAEHSVLGWLVDLVHLVAGGVWLGSLAVVAVIVWRRHGDERLVLVRRYARMALALVVVVAGVGTAVGLLHDGPDPWIPRAVMLVLSPLWFLVVYMALVVTVPLWDRLDQRWGELVPIGLAAAAMGVDLVRFRYGHPEVAWINMILVWGAAHQVGWSWHRLRDATPRFGHALMLIGFAALVGLTNMGLYPRSMVGTTSAADRFSNMGPPTLPIVALLTFQIGLVLVNRERIQTWAARPRVQWFITWLSANAMPLFLWHTVGFAIFYAAMRAVTVVPEGPNLTWWVTRPLWIIGPAAATLPLLVITRRARPVV